MSKKKKQVQQDHYDRFTTCDVDELLGWYKAFLPGYPKAIAPMIKALAVARGFDTSDWPPFYEQYVQKNNAVI